MENGQFEVSLSGRKSLYASLDCPDGKWAITVPKLTDAYDLEGKLRTFSPEDIVIREGKALDYDSNPLMRRYVKERWEAWCDERVKAGYARPENGGLVRVSGIPFMNAEGKIELHLANTRYDEHISTNFSRREDSEELLKRSPELEFSKKFVEKHPEYEFSQNLRYDQICQPLSSLGILVTGDNHLVYSIRSESVATFAGKLSGFGVALSSVEEIQNGGGPVHIFNKMRKSIWNETGMSQSPNAEQLRETLNLELGGWSYLEDGFHTPLFIASTHLEKGDLVELTKSNPAGVMGSSQKKFTDFKFLPIDEDSYREFLRNPKLVKTIRPIWTYLAIQRFGLDFIKSVEN